MVLNISLVTKKVKLLNRYVLLTSNDWIHKIFWKWWEKHDDVLDKYNEIWDKIKKTLSIKLHSMPVYDEKYMKVKVREFNGVIKTNFSEDKTAKENMHYTCIFCITIDSVMRMEKKNYPQVYLEECKYRMKKTKMTKFIEAELKSESESELESDIELELKSELESDIE